MISGIVLLISSYLALEFRIPASEFIFSIIGIFIGIPLIIIGNTLRRLGEERHQFLYWEGWITIFIFAAMLAFGIWFWIWLSGFR